MRAITPSDSQLQYTHCKQLQMKNTHTLLQLAHGDGKSNKELKKSQHYHFNIKNTLIISLTFCLHANSS